MEPTTQKPNNKEGGNEGQELYDIFVAQGIKLASKTSEKMQGKISTELLGKSLFSIVNRIVTEGEKHGIKFNNSVLLHGSREIMGHLIKMSGVEIDDTRISAAVGIAMNEYFDNAVKTGKMTKEEVVQLSEEAKALAQNAAQKQAGRVQGAPMNQGAQPSGIAAPQGMPPQGIPNG